VNLVGKIKKRNGVNSIFNPSSSPATAGHYGVGKIMEEDKNKKVNNEEEFFDDCPICRLMKAAKEQGREPATEELKEAFKKAKKDGAIVGGEWFEQDK